MKIVGQNQSRATVSKTAGNIVSETIKEYRKPHQWVTVVDPTNHRLLLHACDDCGVVKSENSVIRNCKGDDQQGLVSSAQAQGLQLSA